MANDPDENPKVQLASVESEARQYRSRGADNMWDLIGSVKFTESEVSTSHGVKKMTISRATLRLYFGGCENSARGRRVFYGMCRKVENSRSRKLLRDGAKLAIKPAGYLGLA